MSTESDLDKDLLRIYSINSGTPGHEWLNHKVPKPEKTQEIDPSLLNLNKGEDFLKFLNALGQGEEKALAFLHRIPQKRKDELKQMHPQFSGFFPALDQ